MDSKPSKNHKDADASGDPESEEASLINTTRKMVRDMKFVSIFTVITGILYSITIIGAIIGIPTIISGIRLYDSSVAYNDYMNKRNSRSLEAAFRYQQKFFFIIKVMIILAILLFIIYIISMFFLFSHFMEMLQSMGDFNGRMV